MPGDGGGPTRGRREGPRKGDLRERAILDAAEALLEEQGVDPLTVEAIARGAGISRASLYFYFGSKQEVLSALVGRTVALVADDARQAAEDERPDPAESVARAVRRTEGHWRTHGRVMRAAVELSPSVSEIRELWSGTVAAYATAMAAVLVRGGVADGRGATGAAALSRTLCWMQERTFYLASGEPDAPRALRRATATSTEIWLRVLAGGR
jgi:AcrR family transcriptional regulator